MYKLTDTVTVVIEFSTRIHGLCFDHVLDHFVPWRNFNWSVE